MAVDPTVMAGMNPPQSPVGPQPEGSAPMLAGPPPPSQGMPIPPGLPGGIPMDPNAPVDPALMGLAAPPQEEKKPPSLIPTAIARELAQALNLTKMAAAQGLAQHLGDPRGSVNAKDVDLLRAWRKRDPKVDPLFEKIINKKTDEEILTMMYPLRRALIRYGRRTYTEQVEFAERMNRLHLDPRYASLEDDYEDDEEYEPPEAKFPSRGEEKIPSLEDEEEDERVPEEDEDTKEAY
jgi:hypothetical protein